MDRSAENEFYRGKVKPGPKPIIIVQGGQWGSEGKGMVAAALCLERNVDYAVRTGAVNAGHTVYYEGVPYKMQQLPCGWVNEDTELVIGAGALVHPEILRKEVELVNETVGMGTPIHYDYNAGLHLPEHTYRSKVSGRHHSMGATGKGCSEALIDRVRLRGSGGKLLRDVLPGLRYCDTSKLLNEAYDNGKQILLEGTQGSLLDLYLGPYPYTTHKPTQAATWIQECGLSPNLSYEIALVVRTYPIRVAGNSGPMESETDWTHVAADINNALQRRGKQPLVAANALVQFRAACTVASRTFTDFPQNEFNMPNLDLHLWSPEMRLKHKEAVSELHTAALSIMTDKDRAELKKLFEFTTVTNKLRRVAYFDVDNVHKACMWNRPNYLVLSFLNYKYPECWGLESWETCPADTLRDIMGAVADIERECGCPVRYVTTGPESKHFLRWPYEASS